MKFGLNAQTIQQLQNIFEQYSQIECAILYGSRAKGTYKNGSDIDLTLKGNLDLRTLSNIMNDIDESFIPYKCDLSIYKDIENKALLEHINRVGIIFYSSRSSN